MIQARIVSRTFVRNFSRSPLAYKTPVDSVKDGLKAVDRAVSDTAVKGIEKGEEVTQKAKEAAGMGASEAKGKAKEVAGEAKGKMHEAAGAAKGKAEEVKGKM